MSFLAASLFLKALGWALVDSVWQFAVCWLLYRILTGSKNLAAAAKHTIALSLLFLGSILFIAELSWRFYAIPAITEMPVISLVVENDFYTGWQAAGKYADVFIPYWSLLYLACIVLLFIKLCFFVRRAGNLRNSGTTKMNASWRVYLKNVSAQLGIEQEVNAFLSIHIDTPQVIGFFKPVILIPAACLVNLTTEQLEAVLLHELVHIKRNDYLVNLFVASIEILFFFNPFVKQITANIRKEREYSCDDMVIQFQYHPHHYASALLLLEKNRLIPVTYGIAASGKNQKQLLTRIERIVGVKNNQPGFYQAAAGLAVLLLLGFMAALHPAKTNSNMFGPVSMILGDNNSAGQTFNPETSTLLTPKKTKTINTYKIAANLQKKHNRAMAVIENDAEEINEDLLTTVSDDNYDRAITAQHAASKETRDFSLPPTKEMDMPEVPASPVSAEAPYVPPGSFSYQITQDTSLPKIKGETYNERKAREALIKAQKAIAEINWQKIAKNLKYDNQGLAKLKKELMGQLKSLDWQKINAEVQNQISQEQLESLQDAVNQDQLIKQYQQSEAYYEAMQKQLTEQSQVIKISDQRLIENQKATGQQQKKLQLEMKKRRIIYL